MLLADVVAVSAEVASTRSRKAKTAAFAELFARVAQSDTDEIETVTSYLAGSLRQRRTGLGWRAVPALPRGVAGPAAHRPGLAVYAVPARARRRAVADRAGGARGVRPHRGPVGLGLAGRAGGRDCRAVRPGHRAGAAMAARDRDRRGAPRSARLPGPGGAGRGRCRAPGRRAPRRDDGGLDRGCLGGRADRGRTGAGAVRPPGGAAGGGRAWPRGATPRAGAGP